MKEEALEKVREKSEKIKDVKRRLSEEKSLFFGKNTLLIDQLKRPDVSYDDLSLDDAGLTYYEKVQLEVDVKYSGYIERELAKIKKFQDLEKIRVPRDFEYSGLPGLSNEIIEKLSSVRPVSLGQASRVSGVTPVAISILMVRLKAIS